MPQGFLTVYNVFKVPKIANFPEKFPVCREIERRRVRSALRRQPGIPAFGNSLQPASHWPENPACRALLLCDGTCDAFVLMCFERRRSEAAKCPEWVARRKEFLYRHERSVWCFLLRQMAHAG